MLIGPSLSICAENNCAKNSTGHCASSTEDLNTRTTNLANKISELNQRIASNDQAMRTAAIEAALCDDSPTIRGTAMAAALSRFNTLTPQIIVGREDAIDSGNLPNISIADVKWSPDMHSFTGHIVLDGLAGVTGRVTDSRLEVTFSRVKIARELLKVANSNAPSEEVKTCRSHLEINSERNALEGPMSCEGTNIHFKLRLYFLG